MQLARLHKRTYTGIFDCASQIVRNGKRPLGLFHGLGVTMLRESIGYACFFGAYSHIKEITGIKMLDDMIRGVVCGFALWGPIFPIDAVKSRIHGAMPEHRHHSTARHIREIYAAMGWRGFFKGFDITMTRAIPVNIAIVLTVETFKSLVHNP